MSRTVLLVLLVALAPLTGAAVTGDTVGIQEQPTTEQRTTEQPTTETSENNSAGASDVAPGARLAGVVGSQGAAIDGEVTDRALQERLIHANSSAAKAAVIAEALGNANATLNDVEERLAELRAEHEAGNISEGTYRAKVAIAAQRGSSARTVANSSAEATADIPAAALRERGIAPGTAQNISERAGRVVGQDIAEIARGIRGGGPPAGVGGPGGPMGPGSVFGGPPDAENRSGSDANVTGPGKAPGDVGDVPNRPGSDAGSEENGVDAGPEGDGPDAGPEDGTARGGDNADSRDTTTVTTADGDTTDAGDTTTETADGETDTSRTTAPTP